MPIEAARLSVSFSIVDLPRNNGYKPRGDNRVGYFMTSTATLEITTKDQMEAYSTAGISKRTQLKMSPPKEPIIYYIEHTVGAFRRWLGCPLLDNAFAEAGSTTPSRFISKTSKPAPTWTRTLKTFGTALFVGLTTMYPRPSVLHGPTL